MPRAKAEEIDGRLVLRIPCKFEGQSVRRYGEVTLRFRIEEGFLPYALRAVIGADKLAVAVLIHNKEKLPVGRVQFGGLRIERMGESVLSLDTVAEAVKLPIQRISSFADEDLILVLAIRIVRGTK